MPRIEKQTTVPTNHKRSTGVLSRIVPVSELQSGVKINVYGRGKTGKTRLACTFPKPLLLVGTEDGTKSVSNIAGVKYVRLQASEEVKEISDMLAGGSYKTVALDTAGGLQDLILKEILGLAEIPVQKSWGMAQQKDWQICGGQFKERLASLLNLADSIGLNVVVIAHERSFGDTENPSDVMIPNIGCALTPTAAAWLNGACDYVAQAFIREETKLEKVKIGTLDQTMEKKTGRKEFCLRIGPHPNFMTGFRVPPGRELPDSIVDPTFAKIKKLIDG